MLSFLLSGLASLAEDNNVVGAIFWEKLHWYNSSCKMSTAEFRRKAIILSIICTITYQSSSSSAFSFFRSLKHLEENAPRNTRYRVIPLPPRAGNYHSTIAAGEPAIIAPSPNDELQ